MYSGDNCKGSPELVPVYKYTKLPDTSCNNCFSKTTMQLCGAPKPTSGTALYWWYRD
jgi:hypothetical protein